MSRVLVFDGGGYMHRAIFSFRTNSQIPATYTYLQMLTGDLKKLKFTPEDRVIIAQDTGKSWRKGVDTLYKAQRKEAREQKESPEWWAEMYKEFNNFYPKLEASLPWYFVGIFKIEADDIASVACRYYRDCDIILASSDRDWEMLAHYPNVKIFSPRMKKFKVVDNPMGVLIEKIHGDVSDNLLEKPTSELEFEKRKKIVNLLELPEEIEYLVTEELRKLLPKNLYLKKIPYMSIREKIKKLYEKVEDKDA